MPRSLVQIECLRAPGQAKKRLAAAIDARPRSPRVDRSLSTALRPPEIAPWSADLAIAISEAQIRGRVCKASGRRHPGILGCNHEHCANRKAFKNKRLSANLVDNRPCPTNVNSLCFISFPMNTRSLIACLVMGGPALASQQSELPGRFSTLEDALAHVPGRKQRRRDLCGHLTARPITGWQ